jgi:hypothetical protein
MYGHEEPVKDSSRLTLRRGDLIRIPDSKYFSKVSRNEFAVILDRYKYNKFAPGDDRIRYRDYGCEVLMITGPLKGEVKRFYGKLRSSCKFLN